MSLAQRSVRSTTYTLIGSGITTVIQLIRSIILARLIAPEIFGIYSFVSSIVIISSALPNFGMASALLNRVPESEGEKPLQVHFTLSILFNLVWLVIIAVIGSLIISSENHWILWIILATQFVDNLIITSRTLLVRRVIFRRIVIIDTTSIILSTISALVLAWRGFGIHGLISTDIIAAVVAFFGYLVFRPPWRVKFGWSKPIAKYLLDFGYRFLLGSLIGQALDYIDNIWTGFFLGSTSLGYYSRAFTFSSYPRKVLAVPISSVVSGTYSELKGNTKLLSQAFFRSNALLVRTSFFMAGLLALIAPEFINLVIGKQWLPMLDAFRLMLLFTLLDPIKSTLSSLFVAIGKPEKVIWARFTQLIILIVGMFVFGRIWGISGVAVAVNLMILVGIVILFSQALKYVEFSLMRLFGAPTLSLIAGLVFARLSIEIPGVNSSYWQTGFIKVITFGLVYFTVIIILERKELPVLLDYAKIMLPEKTITPSSPQTPK